MLADLQVQVTEKLGAALAHSQLNNNELTLVVQAQFILEAAQMLRDDFAFNQLVDIAGVDYSRFGVDEWNTESVTSTGFSRGVNRTQRTTHIGSRFAVSYHLLSYQKNLRVRIKCFLHDEFPEIASVHHIWPAANWFEREAFDLFGIIFRNHPDLRRILTDYGFIGHPFRKDFPLSGNVEMRYDANLGRIVYEAVEIDPRILVPKVIRHDNRHLIEQEKLASEHPLTPPVSPTATQNAEANK